MDQATQVIPRPPRVSHLPVRQLVRHPSGVVYLYRGPLSRGLRHFVPRHAILTAMIRPGYAPAGSACGSCRAGISRQDCTEIGIITSLHFGSNASPLRHDKKDGTTLTRSPNLKNLFNEINASDKQNLYLTSPTGGLYYTLLLVT